MFANLLNGCLMNVLNKNLFRQKLYRWRNNLKEPDAGILFPGITRPDADEGFVNCIKYLFNKFFFHFGWEVSLRQIFIIIIISY